jgi:hypothetical protein
MVIVLFKDLKSNLIFIVQVTNKAADEEAPLSRANLERTGDDLRERSERLVELANDLLQDPEDSAKKKKFEDEMKALEKGMHAATEPMKEKLSEITRRLVPLFSLLFLYPRSRRFGEKEEIREYEMKALEKGKRGGYERKAKRDHKEIRPYALPLFSFFFPPYLPFAH